MHLHWPQGRRTVIVTRSSVGHPAEIAESVGTLVRAHRELSLGAIATMTGHTVSELRGAVEVLVARGVVEALGEGDLALLGEQPAVVVLRAASVRSQREQG